MSRNKASCLTAQPKTNRRITEGIFVLEDVRSNTYAMSRRTQNVIIIVVVIARKCMFILCQLISSLHCCHSMTANVPLATRLLRTS
jgi:hypothetical protein